MKILRISLTVIAINAILCMVFSKSLIDLFPTYYERHEDDCINPVNTVIIEYEITPYERTYGNEIDIIHPCIHKVEYKYETPNCWKYNDVSVCFYEDVEKIPYDEIVVMCDDDYKDHIIKPFNQFELNSRRVANKVMMNSMIIVSVVSILLIKRDGKLI